MDETWKEIYYYDYIKGELVDYRGLYAVSNIGKIKSLNYRQTGKEKILKQTKDKYGYMRVCLCKDGKTKTFRIHRLVANMFCKNDNLKSKNDIDHINAIRDDNRADNLRWVTRKENINNPLTKQRKSEIMKGENNPMYGKCGTDSPFYDKHHTEESKKKMSEANKGKKYRAKKIIQYDLEMNVIKIWDCMSDVKRELGISCTGICLCCKGKQLTAGGFVWQYAKEEEN